MAKLIQGNCLRFFGASGKPVLQVTPVRTLRIPEEGTYPLPPDLGRFPVKSVDNFKTALPSDWVEKGGVFMTLYQREALWLHFRPMGRPCVVKVGIGKVNAITGKPWKAGLDHETQNYCVIPGQQWLDGINAGDGIIKQFVAVPLGMGYSVEGQVTGKEDVGGIQLEVYEMTDAATAHYYENRQESRTSGVIIGDKSSSTMKGGHALYSGGPPEIIETACSSPHEGLESMSAGDAPVMVASACAAPHEGMVSMSTGDAPVGTFDSSTMDFMEQERAPATRGLIAPRSVPRGARKRTRSMKVKKMGIGAGGSMKQKIYEDKHGVEAWNVAVSDRIFVHLANSEQYREITGSEPPPSPITRAEYQKRGYPWFDVWDEGKATVAESKVLDEVKTVGQMDEQHGFTDQQDDSPMAVSSIKVYQPEDIPGAVRNGQW